MSPQAKEGGKEAGGDRPSEPEKKAEPEPRAERAVPLASEDTPKDDEPQQRKPLDKPAEVAAAAKLPELNLPETANANAVLNEGEALIETVPIPQAKPLDRPWWDVAVSDPQKVASANGARRRKTEPSARRIEAGKGTLFRTIRFPIPASVRALGKLPWDRRIVQMRMIETLEQVRRTREDTVPQGLLFDPRNGSPISGAGDDRQWCRL